MDFKAAFQAFKRRVTDTTVGVAYLGKLENGKRVIKDKVRGGRYVFYTRQLDETVEIGSAILADSSLIPYEEIEDFFGVEIELGYPPAKTELHVLRITAAGYASLGGLNPLEQVLRKVSVMNLDRIGVLRLEPTIPSTLSVKIAGEYYYQSPADGAFKRFAEQHHDLSSEVSALSTDQHRIALLSLDLTDNTIKVTLSSIRTHSNIPKRSAWLDSDILALSTGSWRIPIGIVYLYKGQTAIEEIDILRRYQLRPIFTASAKNNLNATAAPTASDNASQGYAVGSIWRNTTNDKIWICAKATQTTATWKEIAGGSFNSPTTTKGDLIVHNGSGDTRLGVGSNGQVLSADSAEPTGLKWINTNTFIPLNAAGQLLTHDGSAIATLPIGSNGQYLRVNTSLPTKLEWSDGPTPVVGKTVMKRVLLHQFVANGGETGTFWAIFNLTQDYRDLIIQTHGRMQNTSTTTYGLVEVRLYYNYDYDISNYRFTSQYSNATLNMYEATQPPVVWYGHRTNLGNGSPSAYETVVYRYTGTQFKVSRTIGGEYNKDRYVIDSMATWLSSAAVNTISFGLTNNCYLEAGFQILVYGVIDEAETAVINPTFASPPPIGSTTPNTGAFTTLSTNGAFTAANAAQHTFEGLANGTANMKVVLDSWGNFTDGTRLIGRKARGTKTTPAAVNLYDGLLALDARGHDGSSYVTDARGSLNFRASQNWSATAQGTEVILALTPPNTTAMQDRILINGYGEIAQLNANAAFYFGDPSVDGTWRIRRNGNDLVFERRVSGNYVLQFTIPAI